MEVTLSLFIKDWADLYSTYHTKLCMWSWLLSEADPVCGIVGIYRNAIPCQLLPPKKTKQTRGFNGSQCHCSCSCQFSSLCTIDEQKKKVISIVSSAFLLWLHKMIQVKGQRLQFMNKTEAVSWPSHLQMNAARPLCLTWHFYTGHWANVPAAL